MDLARNSSHDYVDNPYWSVMQIKVKQFGYTAPNDIMDQDKGKVILFCNATFEKKFKVETEQ